MSYAIRHALGRRYGGVFGSEPLVKPAGDLRISDPGWFYAEIYIFLKSNPAAPGDWMKLGWYHSAQDLCEDVRSKNFGEGVGILWFVWSASAQAWVVANATQRSLTVGLENGMNGPCCANKTQYTKVQDRKHWNCSAGIMWGENCTPIAYPSQCRCWPERDCPLPDENYVSPPQMFIDETAAAKSAMKAVSPPPVGRPTLTPAQAKALADKKGPVPGSSTPDAKAAAASSEGTPIPVTVIAGALALGVVVLFAVVASKVAEK